MCVYAQQREKKGEKELAFKKQRQFSSKIININIQRRDRISCLKRF